MFNHLPMTTPNPKTSAWRRFAWYHLPVVLYAAVIIAVSSWPNLRTPQVQMIAFDKLAHLAEYAIFAFLVFRSFSHLQAIRANRAIWYAMLFVAVFATLDESYQNLIPGRFSSLADIVADVTGAWLILFFFEARRRRLNSQR